MITQHELKQHLHYDPATGYFTWVNQHEERIMSNWSRVKETMAASDRLNQALGALNKRHMALVEGHGAEELSALAARIEALAAAIEPEVGRHGCPGQGCQDQGCPAHYAG